MFFFRIILFFLIFNAATLSFGDCSSYHAEMPQWTAKFTPGKNHENTLEEDFSIIRQHIIAVPETNSFSSVKQQCENKQQQQNSVFYLFEPQKPVKPMPISQTQVYPTAILQKQFNDHFTCSKTAPQQVKSTHYTRQDLLKTYIEFDFNTKRQSNISRQRQSCLGKRPHNDIQKTDEKLLTEFKERDDIYDKAIECCKNQQQLIGIQQELIREIKRQKWVNFPVEHGTHALFCDSESSQQNLPFMHPLQGVEFTQSQQMNKTLNITPTSEGTLTLQQLDSRNQMLCKTYKNLEMLYDHVLNKEKIKEMSVSQEEKSYPDDFSPQVYTIEDYLNLTSFE